MSEFLRWIETLPPAEALKISFVAYPVVNALHILSVGALVTSVLVMHGVLLTGRRSPSFPEVEALLRPVALAAFAGAVLTGLALFSIRASEYAGNPAFLTKLGLIAAGVLNFLIFARLEMNGASKPALRASSVLSGLIWLSALLAGRFIGFL